MQLDQFLEIDQQLDLMLSPKQTLIKAKPIPVPSCDLLTDCTRWNRSPMRLMSDAGGALARSSASETFTHGMPTPESLTAKIASDGPYARLTCTKLGRDASATARIVVRLLTHASYTSRRYLTASLVHCFV